MVYGLIALNFLVFLKEISLGLIHAGATQEILAFFYGYGLVPAFYSNPEVVVEALGRQPSILEQVLPFLTSIFVHGGIMHILSNMWMLYIFGDNVEDWLGHGWFVLFYVACGVAAGVTHVVFNLGSTMPVVGASGAIAGVMGAYLVLYPRARVVTAIPIFFFLYFAELPAFLFLGFWFLLQIFGTGAGAASSVAWWAHIGGFIAGALVTIIMGGGKDIFGPRGGGGGGGFKPPPNRYSDNVDRGWR